MCARVGMGGHWCAGLGMCVRVDIGVHECACVAICVQVWAFVCRGGNECALVCAAVGMCVHGWALVCISALMWACVWDGCA